MENNIEMLKLKVALQKSKNLVRVELAKMGILQRGAKNTFDNYKYFSEAQYKELFTDLFSRCGVELRSTTLEVENIEAPQKMPYGRRVKMEFALIDVETGYEESSIFVGEAFDKGDKAVYKAYTGAFKYFLANTFAVATGDEVDDKDTKEVKEEYDNDAEFVPAKENQLVALKAYYSKPGDWQKLLEANGVKYEQELSFEKAGEMMYRLTQFLNKKKKEDAEKKLAEAEALLHGE